MPPEARVARGDPGLRPADRPRDAQAGALERGVGITVAVPVRAILVRLMEGDQVERVQLPARGTEELGEVAESLPVAQVARTALEPDRPVLADEAELLDVVVVTAERLQLVPACRADA